MDLPGAVAYVRAAIDRVAYVRGTVASEAKRDGHKCEQRAEDEAREKDAFHGAV
jgi:hypothetical protein